MMFPGLHPMAMMSTVGMGFPRGATSATGMYPPGAQPYAATGGGVYPPGMIPPTGSQQVPHTSDEMFGPEEDRAVHHISHLEFVQETCYLYIPNSAVGAIIGTRGSHIRNIIRFSGASVKIASLPEGTTAEPQAERKVTIIGTPEAQWKVRSF